ncbi:SGM_5486 family transporter-associated protein [Streptomyces sp. NPDC007861]
MPVLDPNPPNGQKKLLLIFGAMIAIGVVIGIIASIASPTH